jgi:predicted nucleotidyltransferase
LARSHAAILKQADPMSICWSRFFELRDRLAALFECDVDLVIESGLRNPYLIRSIEQDRRLLYAA